MTDHKVRYPGPGCVVECMQGNSPMLALVLEEQGGRLRLYTQNRRETNLTAARLLPWSGPALPAGLSRQAMDAALEERRSLRAALQAEISLNEVWELTAGEVEKASSEWLAGLVWAKPTIDHEAALGHVLLASKTHFRFSPPDFEIFSPEMVEKRTAEAEAAALREAVASAGAGFFRALWEIHSRRRGPLAPHEHPEAELAAKLRSLLMARLQDPDSPDEGGLWKQLVKGLPESPLLSQHLPLHLATAWGLVPPHHNFWLERAGFDPGDAWAAPFAGECRDMRERLAAESAKAQVEEHCFVSVDPADTTDRDDAFFVEMTAGGNFHVCIALACPASVWPFGGPFDKAALRRSTSLYLPEGDEHMLPAEAGRDLFSLDAGELRPSLVLELELDPAGNILQASPRLSFVRVRANLALEECEAVLAGGSDGAPESAGNATTGALSGEDAAAHGAGPVSRAESYAPMLRVALALANVLQAGRIAAGAVITERPDPEVVLAGSGHATVVRIENPPPASLSHLVVGELMILCNGYFASWARENGLPLLFRAQDVPLPREFSGVWTEPQDISRVVRLLPPAGLELQPKRHAGLGLAAYSTVSSPIRRYVDLLNQGQIVHFLQTGVPRLGAADLAALFPLICARQDVVTQVQRFRPRYWKLLFFQQQGDKVWWKAVVTDENDAFVSVSLPWAQLLLRGRRRQFDEKLYPGQHVEVRLGKVDPLANEVQILEAREA